MIYCQTTTPPSPNFLSNCSFLNQTYFSYAAVSDQIQFNNHTSIILTASYSFSSSPFQLGLIYEFSILNYFVPFPIIFDCASIVHSCQLKTMPGTTITSRDSEPIRVQLTSFNYTTTTTLSPLNQMGLYLKQGRYQLSNCSLNNGEQMTDPQTIFYIQIQYEKSVGTPCDPMGDTCGSPNLTTCVSSKCACLSSSSFPVSYSNLTYCADMLTISNCKIFPSRCITWCNGTTNYLCICPSGTLKIQRQNISICELPVNSYNCSMDEDDVRRCPYGQCCMNKQCMDCSVTTSKSTNINDSDSEGLRIALGVIAGLLGTSVIILIGAFCWLRKRQKRHRIAAKKSLSSSVESSRSSLYISPIQHQEKFPSSISTIYQTSLNNESKNPTFYRTDSFCQAVLSGNKKKQTIERVSTKRDSYAYQKDGWSSPTFSTLEFIIPSVINQKQSIDFNKEHNNIYQIPMPSTPSLTHAV